MKKSSPKKQLKKGAKEQIEAAMTRLYIENYATVTNDGTLFPPPLDRQVDEIGYGVYYVISMKLKKKGKK